MINKFCDDQCKYLNPTEMEQKTIGVKLHWCEKYNKKVIHMQYHPKILRLDECIGEEND